MSIQHDKSQFGVFLKTGKRAVATARFALFFPGNGGNDGLAVPVYQNA